MAAELGTNKLYLSNAISQHEGLTFSKYLNRWRLEYARQMLLTDHTSKIEAIAVMSGFNSVRTFYRLFQRYYQLTPTEFRLLREFVSHRGQLLTYDVLLDRLWEGGSQLMDRHALTVNVGRLRGKIEDAEHKYISNVYGMGYQWIG